MAQKRICLITTVYSFFLYLLKYGYSKDDLFIFTASFSKDVSRNVKHIDMPRVSFPGGILMAPINSLSGIWRNISGYAKYFYGYLRLRILLAFISLNNDLEIYGHAQSPFSFMFYVYPNCTIIEDGLFNYSMDVRDGHKINPVIDKLLHICGIYFLHRYEALGSHKNIKKIVLTRPHEHPLLKDKVEVINIEDLWNSKSKKEKEEILKLFNLDAHALGNIDQDTVLLLTQPLYDDGYITLDEEMKIYTDTINKFKSKKIVIKPHPMDNKDYKKIFPDLKVIEKSFPVELLPLVGINPGIVSSTISTAMLNFKDSKLDIYDGELSSSRINQSREDLRRLLK